ncbi:OLC1v1031538C1 [Oldenlandia corymbosa var. corymbosa]|uniref:OLC1v1031538C1 n=1 Tax=Oldenlandia corymbosa var. corymbosa TaxID=529605 RepID=A0AAV1CJI4_OLDCO|nr:OLC1v1031538C1 [Oldenlandia corymbosa var. corymbosa]
MNRKSSGSIPVAGDGVAATLLLLGAAVVLIMLSSGTADAQINNILCCKACETVAADVCYANCTVNGVLVPTSACVTACGQNYISCAAPCGTCAPVESVFCCQNCRLKSQVCYDNCLVQGSGSAQPDCVYNNCVIPYAACADTCPGGCV